MFWRSTVLPARGGETMRQRCPLPMGEKRSTMRVGHLARRRARGVSRSRRVERREVVEEDLRLALLGRLAVDRVDLQQREVPLALLGLAHRSADRVAGAQVEPADLRGRHVDVVGPGQVGEVGAAQEAEAVGEHLQRALAGDLHLLLGRLGRLRLGLQDREDQVLLLQGAGRLDVQLARHPGELRHLQVLQVGEARRGGRGGGGGGGHVGPWGGVARRGRGCRRSLRGGLWTRPEERRQT